MQDNNYPNEPVIGENDIVQDTYVVINLWSRPLRRHRYHVGEVRKCRTGNSGSSLLAASFRNNSSTPCVSPGIKSGPVQTPAASTSPAPANPGSSEADAKEKKEEDYFDLGSRILSETPKEFLAPKQPAAASSYSPEDEDDYEEDIKPKKISLRIKLRNALYDYTEIQQEEMEEKVDALINRDGFYDEVVPVDANEDYVKRRSGPDIRIVIVVGALAVVTIAMIYMFKEFF